MSSRQQKIEEIKKLLIPKAPTGHVAEFFDHLKNGSYRNCKTAEKFKNRVEFENRKRPDVPSYHCIIFEDYSSDLQTSFSNS